MNKSKSTIKCTNCGKELPSDARFCNECGAKVGSSQTTAGGTSQTKRANGQMGGFKMPNTDSLLQEEFRESSAAFTKIPQGVGSEIGMMGSGAMSTKSTYDGSPKKAEHTDMVVAVAKWSGAIRRLLIDKNPAAFAGTVRELLDMIEPFQNERDQFQNIMYLNIISMVNNRAVVPALEAALNLFPERLRTFYTKYKSFDKLDIGGPWKDVFDSWPYSTFQFTWDMPDNKLAEICIQSIYEGAFVYNLAPNGYIEDEQARINGGLYPDSIKPVIQRAIAKCHSVDLSEYGNSADQRADVFLKQYAPFGHPKFYRELQGKLAIAGMAMPAAQENITDWELQQMHNFAKDQEYNRKEVLSMLINRWEIFTNQISRMDDMLRTMFFFQHFMLTVCLNMHSRRADPVHHKDYGNFLEGGDMLSPDYNAILKQNAEEKLPHLFRSLWPEQESLFILEYRIRYNLAMKASQTKSPQEFKAQVSKQQQNISSTPPGHGPGKQLADGTICYPMIPDLQLTADGEELRQQAAEIALDLILADDQEADYSQLRSMVSKNLKAFGLTHKRYASMDDSTLHQYVLDITS
jgi:hypothetical protein